MNTSFWRRSLNQFNHIFSFTGFEIVRKGHEFQDYIPLKKTLVSAEKSGLSLADYIDNSYNVPGTTQLTIERMTQLGVFDHPINRVCEIGPGSGRYLEQVIARCNPEYYEIYETSKPWRKWLVEKYNITAQPADGVSLASTPGKSIDLVHTHKMLYGNPVLAIFRYWMEMARIVKEDGVIVFDLLTSECMSNEIIRKWIESGADHACSMTPKQVALEFFAERGFRYLGGFIVPMAPGLTEYFIFKK